MDQLLTQTGFKTIGTDSVSFGSIFNCTVISGQSRAYLMALLHFATYFLRFMCLIHTQECLPELGPADLFELEQQKRRCNVGKDTLDIETKWLLNKFMANLTITTSF
ncbi:unnamed protein product [Schistosoma mattheei]|uniref:Uncharacterized protein n=1 Tax=Schistosoma mattheei TaxID=31246 RepID=A0A3P7ZXR2_9TREM|nr:unnamed protein product [Schistosoma mattheei]